MIVKVRMTEDVEKFDCGTRNRHAEYPHGRAAGYRGDRSIYKKRLRGVTNDTSS